MIIGAGFAGLYAHYLLRQQGLQVVGFDAAGDVGGTWWWNRYPGARCDIESRDYSYSFSPEVEQEWTWSERYASQPEILRYLSFVADKFDLRRDIHFDTRVTSVHWDDERDEWEIGIDRHSAIRARFAVMASGCLSSSRVPDFPGLDTFTGRVLQTARWPHEPVELAGQRVAVIGTGSSGVQSIPLIAEQAERLTVFQRTPSFALPAMNRALTPDEVAGFKATYRDHRAATRASHGGLLNPGGSGQPALSASPEERDDAYTAAWGEGALFSVLSCYSDIMIDKEANETAAEFIRGRIRTVVEDPRVAETLSPRTYPFGAKRACLDTNYYATYNRPNVELVDLRAEPIEQVTATGVRTSARAYPVDVLVFATGFDAITGPLLAMDIRGWDGLALREAWAEHPDCYLGVSIAGFPNLFTITGPGSPSVLVNMAASIEQHVEWVAAAIAYVNLRGFATIEAQAEDQQKWMGHVAEMADFTLWPRAESWYTGANVPGKPRRFMPYIAGMQAFRQVCDEVVADGYRGFALRRRTD